MRPFRWYSLFCPHCTLAPKISQLFPNHGTSGSFLYLLQPQFSRLQNGNNSGTHTMGHSEIKGEEALSCTVLCSGMRQDLPKVSDGPR
jgi:hypothetical protein